MDAARRNGEDGKERNLRVFLYFPSFLPFSLRHLSKSGDDVALVCDSTRVQVRLHTFAHLPAHLYARLRGEEGRDWLLKYKFGWKYNYICQRSGAAGEKVERNEPL